MPVSNKKNMSGCIYLELIMRMILQTRFNMLPLKAIPGEVILFIFFLLFFQPLFAWDTSTGIPKEVRTPADKVLYLVKLNEDTVRTSPELAHSYALQAIALLPEVKDSTLHAEAYYALGAAFTEMGKYGEAIAEFNKSADLFLKTGVQHRYGNAMNYLGVIYDYLGDYDEALEYYLASLNAMDNNNPKGLVFAYNNIALIHMAEEAYDKAQNSLMQAIDIALENQVEVYLTYPYHNLGDLYSEKGKLDSALYYYNLSYEIDKEQNDQEGVGINLKSMGEVYAKFGMTEQAASYLKKALNIHQEHGDKVNLSSTYNSLSGLFYDIQQTDKAIEAAKQALNYAQPLKLKLQIKNAAGMLSKIYKERGDYQQALYYSEMYHDYHDSLFNEAKTKELALLQLRQSEVERKLLESDNQLKAAHMDDQQILIEKQTYLVIFISFGLILSVVILVTMNNANRERRLAYEQLVVQKQDIEQIIGKLKGFNEEVEAQKVSLENSNKIKDKLISIISHDFRSPLNSLEGILDLMSRGQISNDEMKIIANDLRLKVNITTSLLDNLLNWAKNQMQGIKPEPRVFDINDLVKETTSLLSLQAENKGVKIVVQTAALIYVFADYEMTKLILRNLINNAIKFTNRGDQVVVSSLVQPDKLMLQVRDTGIGMREEQLENVFTDASGSRLGTSHEKGTGLGLKLCKDFVEKNGGKISVESKEGLGSTFFFTIPLAKAHQIRESSKKNELKLYPKGMN